MNTVDKKRAELLGMHPSTAQARLLRDILFDYVSKASEKCYRCGGELSRDNFSIDHKEHWMQADNPFEAFFDIENISYSHQSCNSGAQYKRGKGCGTLWSYKKGCRCNECVEAKSKENKRSYDPIKRKDKYKRLGT